MHALKNHPGMWLDDEAGASFDRWEDTYGVLELSGAGRTDAEQRELMRRWAVGGEFNRPPYLYQPAYPSPHQSGLAIDTPDHNRFSQTCAPYGWRFNIGSDPVHAIYEAARDSMLGTPTNGGNATLEGEQHMFVITARGAVFTIGQQYIRHETYYHDGEPRIGAVFTRDVVSADDRVIECNEDQARTLFTSFAIPEQITEKLKANPGSHWSAVDQLAHDMGKWTVPGFVAA